ncbi:MAG: hypothetical protein ACPL1Y_01250 [Thermoplasmata archaeon]
MWEKKSTIRMEVVKAITDLANDREARDRIDKGILSHVKGREHWMLHLFLKAMEAQQQETNEGLSHILTTTNSVYKDLGTKLENVRTEITTNLVPKIKTEIGEIEAKNFEKIAGMIEASFEKVNAGLSKSINESIGKTAEAINAQALETKNLTQALARDVGDTFKVATQVRLLISENMRKLNEIADAITSEGGGSAQSSATSGSIESLQPIIEKIGAEIKELKGFEEKIDMMLKGVNKHIDITSVENQNRMENLIRTQMELARKVEKIEKDVEAIKTSIEAIRTLLLEIKSK